MLLIYTFCTKLIKALINILFVIQIALMILVFLLTSYWLFDLINLSTFNFVAPIADIIIAFINTFYNNEIQIGGVYFDPSLLLFDIIAIGVVILISKMKFYIFNTLEYLEKLIEDCKRKIEAKFNKSLQQEFEKEIKKCNKTAVLVRFSANSMMVDAFWGGNEDDKAKQEKENEAFKILYSSLKNLTGCKFAKTDDKMLILLDDFSKIDNLLQYIDHSINRIRQNMKKKKWNLRSYIALEVYCNNENFKEDVYPVLEKLLELNLQNQAICMGSFCLRYDLLPQKLYQPFLRGNYNIGEEVSIWSLVKKS